MDSIQLCEYTTIYSFFSLGEHFIYFQVLYIINKAGMFPFLLWKYLEEENAG